MIKNRVVLFLVLAIITNSFLRVAYKSGCTRGMLAATFLVYIPLILINLKVFAPEALLTLQKKLRNRTHD